MPQYAHGAEGDESHLLVAQRRGRSDLAQRGQDLFSRRHPRREHPSKRTDNKCEEDAGHHGSRGNSELEGNLAEGYEATDAGGDPV